jgi:hypothetical protein
MRAQPSAARVTCARATIANTIDATVQNVFGVIADLRAFAGTSVHSSIAPSPWDRVVKLPLSLIIIYQSDFRIRKLKAVAFLHIFDLGGTENV